MREYPLAHGQVDRGHLSLDHFRAVSHEKIRENKTPTGEKQEDPVLTAAIELHRLSHRMRSPDRGHSPGRICKLDAGLSADGLLDRGLEILFSTKASVDDLSRTIEHDDIGGGGSVIGSAGFTLRVEQLSPGKLVLVHVSADARGGLIHGHRDSDEGDLFAVFLVQHLHARLELLTIPAPGGPELQQHRLFADVLAEIRDFAIE